MILWTPTLFGINMLTWILYHTSLILTLSSPKKNSHRILNTHRKITHRRKGKNTHSRQLYPFDHMLPHYKCLPFTWSYLGTQPVSFLLIKFLGSIFSEKIFVKLNRRRKLSLTLPDIKLFENLDKEFFTKWRKIQSYRKKILDEIFSCSNKTCLSINMHQNVSTIIQVKFATALWMKTTTIKTSMPSIVSRCMSTGVIIACKMCL